MNTQTAEAIAQQQIPEHPYPEMSYPASAVTDMRRKAFIKGMEFAASQTQGDADYDSLYAAYKEETPFDELSAKGFCNYLKGTK